jgi:hypothetical protein
LLPAAETSIKNGVSEAAVWVGVPLCATDNIEFEFEQPHRKATADTKNVRLINFALLMKEFPFLKSGEVDGKIILIADCFFNE